MNKKVFLAGLLTIAAVAIPFAASAVTVTNLGPTFGLGTADLESTVIKIVQWALGFLGLVAVIMILIGGFQWMTAGGNEEKVAESKKLIIAGIIGLAIIFGAYAIASFVIQQLATATGV